MERFTLAELEAMPTLGVARTAYYRKYDDGYTRVWLARTTVADGEPWPRPRRAIAEHDIYVIVEKFNGIRWVTVDEYPAHSGTLRSVIFGTDTGK